MVSLYASSAWVLLLLVQYGLALVPRTATITAPPSGVATSAPMAPITIMPGFALTTTVIRNVTYPVLQLGGQIGYDVSVTDLDLSGLVGLTLGVNASTLPGGEVYPLIELVVAEADTENFTIPGVLTFFDGGLHTTGKETTDVFCTVDNSGLGCSGLAGRVTGTLLGVPFNLPGGLNPHLSIPQSANGSLVLEVSAHGTAGIANFTNTGAIGVGVIAAPTFLSAGIEATGDGDDLGLQVVVSNTTAYLEVGLCETKVLGICSTVTI